MSAFAELDMLIDSSTTDDKLRKQIKTELNRYIHTTEHIPFEFLTPLAQKIFTEWVKWQEERKEQDEQSF